MLHSLRDNARTKTVSTTDLKNTLGAIEHLRDKLIPRQSKNQALGVIIPTPAGHEPEFLRSTRTHGGDHFVVLRLTLPLLFFVSHVPVFFKESPTRLLTRSLTVAVQQCRMF